MRDALRHFDDAMDEDDGGLNGAGDDDSTEDGECERGEGKEDSGGGDGLVTEETVLEATGEDDLVSVTQLILRNRRMSGFSDACAAGLPNLANLSLSHNRVASLVTFGGHFGALLELNLNFNRVGSLDGLVAPLLTKLFLSTNRLADGCLIGFSRRFPKLQSLCLYRNGLRDLQDTLACVRQLPKLRELDLDGNPLAFDPSSEGHKCTITNGAIGYRHVVVRSLGHRLTHLDGEAVMPFDRELAEAFFKQQRDKQQAAEQQQQQQQQQQRRQQDDDGGRTGMIGRRDVLGKALQAAAEVGCSSSPSPSSGFNWSDLPPDDVELIGVVDGGGASARSSLNNNPVLVTYLAQGVLIEGASGDGADGKEVEEKGEGAWSGAGRLKSKGGIADRFRSDAAEHKASGGGDTGDYSRFDCSDDDDYEAGKIATATALSLELPSSPPGGETVNPRTVVGSPFDDGEVASSSTFSLLSGAGQRGGEQQPPSRRRPGTALTRRVRSIVGAAEGDDPSPSSSSPSSSSSSSSSSFGAEQLDMSDPYAIIRRLVKMVELLKEERRVAQESGWAECGAGVTPGKPLQALQQELTELRVENANMFVLQEENRQLAESAACADSAEAAAAQLRAENTQLKRDLAAASEQLQAMHLSHRLFLGGGGSAGTGSSSGASRSGSRGYGSCGGSGGAGESLPSSAHSTHSYGDGSWLPPAHGGGRFDALANTLPPRPITAAEVLEEAEDDMDAELTELFAKNETALRQIRHDVKKVKKELDQVDDTHTEGGATSSSSSSDRSRRSSRCKESGSCSTAITTSTGSTRGKVSRNGEPEGSVIGLEVVEQQPKSRRQPPSITELLNQRRQRDHVIACSLSSSSANPRQGKSVLALSLLAAGPEGWTIGDDNETTSAAQARGNTESSGGQQHQQDGDEGERHLNIIGMASFSHASSRGGGGGGRDGSCTATSGIGGGASAARPGSRLGKQRSANLAPDMGRGTVGRTANWNGVAMKSGSTVHPTSASSSSSSSSSLSSLSTSSEVLGSIFSGKVARRQYGDVITVHSPRQAAEIFDKRFGLDDEPASGTSETASSGSVGS